MVFVAFVYVCFCVHVLPHINEAMMCMCLFMCFMCVFQELAIKMISLCAPDLELVRKLVTIFVSIYMNVILSYAYMVLCVCVSRTCHKDNIIVCTVHLILNL